MCAVYSEEELGEYTPDITCLPSQTPILVCLGTLIEATLKELKTPLSLFPAQTTFNYASTTSPPAKRSQHSKLIPTIYGV